MARLAYYAGAVHRIAETLGYLAGVAVVAGGDSITRYGWVTLWRPVFEVHRRAQILWIGHRVSQRHRNRTVGNRIGGR